MGVQPAPAAIPLAFGCFHFLPILERGDRFDASAYPDAVREALEDSPGIDNVGMSVDEEALGWEAEVPGAPPSLAELGSPFPRMGHSGIRFDVRIPRRMQEDLLRGDRYGIGTEEFRVHLEYGYEMPVVAVEPLNPREGERPSRAVMLVREFLIREFERSMRSTVTFDWLGPSPAHSDFYLIPSEAPEDCPGRFWLLDHTVRGYRRYRYGYRAEDFNDRSEVVDRFLFEATSELSLYYALAQESCARMEAWDELEEMVTELVGLQRKRGPFAFIRKTLLASRKVSDAQLALIEFRSRDVTAGGELERRCAKLYEQRGFSAAQALVEDRQSDRFEYPTAEIAELLRLIETRRLTDRDVMMLGLASVLGGALGALGGVLAG